MEESQVKHKQSPKSLMILKQELKKIGAGRTATIFRYGQDQVVKLFKSTFPQKAINEEFEIGCCLNLSGLSIPTTYELIEVDDTKGILFDFVEGRSMLQNLASQPWLLLRYAKKMASVHFKIHRANYKGNKFIKPLSQSIADKISRVNLLTSEEKLQSSPIFPAYLTDHHFVMETFILTIL